MPGTDTLTSLLGMYVSILLVSSVLSGVALYITRDKLNQLLFLLWITSFANFMLQGAFRDFGLSMILAFSTYFPCAILLVRILETTTQRRHRHRAYAFFMGVALLWTLISSAFEQHFTVRSLFVAIAIAFPMLDAAICTLTDKTLAKTGMMKVLCVLVILNALHFLDYPFLRHSDANAVVGFSIELIFLFSFAIFLPQFSIAHIAARYAGTLEDKVREKTQSLLTANTELQTITRENQLLLSVLCHDIANPLTLIGNGIELLVEGDTKNRVESLTRMQRAVNSLNDMLRSARSLHAVRSGKSHINLQPVPIVALVKSAISDYEEACKNKGVHLMFDSRVSADTAVLADPMSLKNHVLSNLFSNAIKYSYPGDAIEVRLEGEAETVHLSVADHGIGIPKTLIGQLFDMETPTTRAGTRNERGTGFGMPIVKRYLDKYKADIRIESHLAEEGSSKHGTTIHVHFKKAA